MRLNPWKHTYQVSCLNHWFKLITMNQYPESGQTRGHCFLAMFPKDGLTRKHCSQRWTNIASAMKITSEKNPDVFAC